MVCDPLAVDRLDRNDREPPVAGEVFDEVQPVGGPDDPAASLQSISHACVRLAYVIEAGGEEPLDRFALPLPEHAVDLTPFVKPGAVKDQLVVLEVA